MGASDAHWLPGCYTVRRHMGHTVTSTIQPESGSHGEVRNGEAVLLKPALPPQNEGLLSLPAANIVLSVSRLGLSKGSQSARICCSLLCFCSCSEPGEAWDLFLKMVQQETGVWCCQRRTTHAGRNREHGALILDLSQFNPSSKKIC